MRGKAKVKKPDSKFTKQQTILGFLKSKEQIQRDAVAPTLSTADDPEERAEPPAEPTDEEPDVFAFSGDDAWSGESSAERTVKHVLKKEPMDEMERLLIYKTGETLRRLCHSLTPAFNVTPWPLDFADMRNYPSCTISTPQPVFVAPKHADRLDVCHQRTLRRENYRMRLEQPCTRYRTAHKNRKVRSLEKKDEYHRSVFDLAERLEHHPDAYFHGNYDYYYSGGSLCVLPDQGHVLHVTGPNLQQLNVSQFSESATKALRTVSTKDFPNGSEIFEVRSIRSDQAERNSCFAVRQRNTISLCCLRENGAVKMLTHFKNERTPFISFAQSPTDAHVLAVTTMTQHLRHYDLNERTPVLSKRYDLFDGGDDDEYGSNHGWNVVRPWRDRTFLYANQRHLLFADLRTTPDQWLQRACGLAPADAPCDLISAVAASEFDNLVYVGTAHKLHCLDVRFLGSHFEDTRRGGALCRWTHQLQHAPAFIETFCYDRTEFVTLSSVVAGDLCVCELTREVNAAELRASDAPEPSPYLHRSYTLPYQPPTLREAYEHARLAGRCLQPEADLGKRIRCCTTGLAFHYTVQSTWQAMLLSANSNGDVFVSDIGERSTQLPEVRCGRTSDEMMARYEKQICELTQPPLAYTDVRDLSAMGKVFRCVALNSTIKEEQPVAADGAGEGGGVTAPAEPLTKRRFLGRWQKSMPTLHAYKDALAPDLLSIWDIEYDKEADLSLRQITKELQIKPDPAVKVNEWLEATRRPPPMTSIPAANCANLGGTLTLELNETLTLTLTPTQPLAASETLLADFGAEARAKPQSTQLEDDTIATMDSSAQDMLVNDTTLQPSKKPKAKTTKKKAKYVKGF